MRIAVFVTCVTDSFFPQTGKAMVRLLERLGCEADFPAGQTCCGQMHFNTGYQRECVPLVRRFVDAFDGYQAVVTPSGSCGGMVREYHSRVAAVAADREAAGAAYDPALAAAVGRVRPHVYELSEFLVDVLGVTDVGAYFPHRVTYHPTCHSLRALRVGDRPRRLLSAVRGLDLVELPAAEECCGFGGTFAMKNADVSVAIVADKIRHIRATAADVVCAVDNACLTHIGGALSRLRSGVRVMHLAEILAETSR